MLGYIITRKSKLRDHEFAEGNSEEGERKTTGVVKVRVVMSSKRGKGGCEKKRQVQGVK